LVDVSSSANNKRSPGTITRTAVRSKAAATLLTLRPRLPRK